MRSSCVARDTIIFESKGSARPDLRFVFRHPAHFIALGFGVGLIRVTPGTFGTLLAWGLYAAGLANLDVFVYLLSVVAAFALGVWACDIAGRALGHSDHGAMVWDEVAAFLLVLAFTPPTIYWQLGAFVLFRVFDIAKPPPIRYYERKFKGGFGVMFDDIIAAAYTLLVLALARTFFG